LTDSPQDGRGKETNRTGITAVEYPYHAGQNKNTGIGLGGSDKIQGNQYLERGKQYPHDIRID